LELEQKAQVSVIQTSITEDGRFVEEEKLMESDLEGFVVHPYHSKLLHSLFFQVIEGEDAHEQKWRGVNDGTCLSWKHLSAANHQS